MRNHSGPGQRPRIRSRSERRRRVGAGAGWRARAGRARPRGRSAGSAAVSPRAIGLGRRRPPGRRRRSPRPAAVTGRCVGVGRHDDGRDGQPGTSGVAGTSSPRVRRTSSSRVASRWAASFSGSMRQRAPGEQVRPEVVGAFEGDPGQPDDRDRVARVVRRDLLVQLLGPVDPPEREGAFRLQQQLDHVADLVPGAHPGERPLGQQEQGSRGVERRIGDDPLEQHVEDASEGRARLEPELGHEVRAVDRQPARSSATPAASCAAMRARSSSSRPASAGRPEPDVVRLAERGTGHRARRGRP